MGREGEGEGGNSSEWGGREMEGTLPRGGGRLGKGRGEGGNSSEVGEVGEDVQ